MISENLDQNKNNKPLSNMHEAKTPYLPEYKTWLFVILGHLKKQGLSYTCIFRKYHTGVNVFTSPEAHSRLFFG
jgi:hypothetical protein